MKSKEIQIKAAKHKSKHWVKEVLKFIVIVTLFSIVIGYLRSQYMSNKNIPPLAISSINGDWVDIENMSHKKTALYYFWATLCPVFGMVSLIVNWLSDSHQVVSVAITSSENRHLIQFRKNKNYDFSTINDAIGSINQQWAVTASPSIFIVKNGGASSITTDAQPLLGCGYVYYSLRNYHEKHFNLNQ